MAGLLDLVREYGAGVKERVGLLGRDPVEYTRQALLDVLPSDAEAKAAKNMLMGGEVDRQAYQKYLAKMQDMGSFLGSIKVYHGSPHKFDKFDLSKIGTGEGAQAYGHGAYVAESPAVAQDYATSLSGRLPDRLKIDGNAVRGDSIYSRALEDVALIGKDGALQKLDDNIRFNEKYAPDMAAMYRSAREKIAAVDPARVDLNLGHLYEANLRWPDAAREAADPLGPQHFLDWDAPLSKQPEAIKNALRNSQFAPDESVWPSYTGAQLYQGEMNATGPYNAAGWATSEAAPPVSNMLRRQGIPGIRYLDAGSRGAGQGSSNYVVFDDALIDILTRNGVPVK